MRPGSASNPLNNHPEVSERIKQYEQGLIHVGELMGLLKSKHIHGDIKVKDGKVTFVGFDYVNQNWIVI